MDGTPMEWFVGEWKVNRDSTWNDWSTRFLDCFADKGWNEWSYAAAFKYMSGSYSEYIVKKNALLIDAMPEMTEKIRVGFCVIGLPNNIRGKIDPKYVDTQGTLLSEVNRLDPFRGNKTPSLGRPGEKNEGSFRKNNNDGSRNSSQYKDCGFCTKRGFTGRKHPEKYCWNNPDSPTEKRRVLPQKTDP